MVQDGWPTETLDASKWGKETVSSDSNRVCMQRMIYENKRHYCNTRRLTTKSDTVFYFLSVSQSVWTHES